MQDRGIGACHVSCAPQNQVVHYTCVNIQHGCHNIDDIDDIVNVAVGAPVLAATDADDVVCEDYGNDHCAAKNQALQHARADMQQGVKFDQNVDGLQHMDHRCSQVFFSLLLLLLLLGFSSLSSVLTRRKRQTIGQKPVFYQHLTLIFPAPAPCATTHNSLSNTTLIPGLTPSISPLVSLSTPFWPLMVPCQQSLLNTLALFAQTLRCTTLLQNVCAHTHKYTTTHTQTHTHTYIHTFFCAHTHTHSLTFYLPVSPSCSLFRKYTEFSPTSYPPDALPGAATNDSESARVCPEGRSIDTSTDNLLRSSIAQDMKGRRHDMLKKEYDLFALFTWPSKQ